MSSVHSAQAVDTDSSIELACMGQAHPHCHTAIAHMPNTRKLVATTMHMVQACPAELLTCYHTVLPFTHCLSQTALHGLQEAAYPGTADGDWPATFSHLLKMVPEGSQRDKAKSFFAGLLHPNPADRLTAAQAFEHRFVKQS